MSKHLNPIFANDVYKLSHFDQVPGDCSLIYSHLTPRFLTYLKQKFPSMSDKVIVYGIQLTIAQLQERWNTGFFDLPWRKINKESLELLSKDKKCIAIVSTLEKKEIENAVSIIETVMNAKGISVKALKDYNIKQISECDATLVCEKLDVSVLEKCVNEFETLKTYKLEVLGIVYA